jgi:hypothetical protein
MMQLLSAVNKVVAAHGVDGGCCHCAVADRRRDCPNLGLAAAAVDLIVQCWRIKRSTRNGPAGHLSRDLRAAVESRRLTDSEAAALTKIIEMLALAVIQADNAGLSLPMLAGIGWPLSTATEAWPTTPRPLDERGHPRPARRSL